MTPIEKRIASGLPVSFREALYDACMHGELTMSMAKEWLDGDDLALALRVIESRLFIPREAKEPGT